MTNDRDIVDRARLVADLIDAYECVDKDPADIVDLLRSLAAIVERLDAEASMLEREVSRESGLRFKLEEVLREHSELMRVNRDADDKARSAIAAREGAQ